MNTIQALLFAVLQGVTELFPISSLGHGVILPRLLGWSVDQQSPDFLPFLVVLHVGTALALLIYFWRDWAGVLGGIIHFSDPGRAPDRQLLVLLIAGTIPAVIIGFLLEHYVRGLFGSPLVAAIFLVVNGFILFAGERLRQREGDGRMDELTIMGALVIGLWQCLALIPGISRSGVTIVGALLIGLRHEDSARLSFLLATPIIAGAAVLELPKMIRAEEVGAMGLSPLVLVSGLVAGITAYLSVAFLMRYFHRHEFQALNPFAYYCWAAGVAAALLLLV